MKKILATVLVIVMAISLCGCDSSNYKKATSLYEAGNYEEAAAMFEELGDYENSAEMVNVCKYTRAAKLLDSKEYESARAIFVELGDYADSANFVNECNYQQAEELFSAGSYEEAIVIYETILDYNDSKDKIKIAKKELMFIQYGDVIQMLTNGVWFFNGGSDAAVNRIAFTKDAATITQFVSDGNGTHTNGNTDFAYFVDETNIVVTLVDGSEQIIPYMVEGNTIVLDGGTYLTPEAVEADLQGYWGLRKSDNILGMSTENEYITFFDNGKLVMERAAKAYGGKKGEYHYYGPDEGTYTIDENGLTANIKNSWQVSFSVIDGKAVMVRCGDVCSPVSGFKGENGYSF